MKRVCLYSMYFVLCVLCVCTMALVLSACSVRNDKQLGVDDRMSYESEPVTAKAVPIERGTSGSENEVTTPLENEKAARKGYNPEMAFNYDEHEDIEVDDNYVASLCAEAERELEVMFGPAEFYIRAENNGEDSYTINIMYNGEAAEFDDDELQQIYAYIGQEYKEVKLTDINIQSW
ncbi:hypothetical protein [Lachnospira eligens]|uniref:Uncharacterized protein n=1 Tax=Lachnospira eligens TaxID=39485 RepID=A0A414DA30_9FIRM|nr:hypothetical protein [Lachnospira eligens]RHD07311.1 hypothetical protein DW811_10445 [Lachnospira eligens]